MFRFPTVHTISLVIGIIFLFFSLYLAFFVPFSHFYTSFALATWLIFDYVDYRLNGTSILTFFYQHKHRIAFIPFFIIAFVFCFVVDYVWGVRLIGAWEWINYTWMEYLRMYLIMNISFVLSMYELYRVVKTLIKTYVRNENLITLRVMNRNDFYTGLLLTGIFFLIAPIFVVAFELDALAPFVMIFPFISIGFITDAITYFTKGTPVLEEFFRLNKLQLAALLLSVCSAFIVTEALNLFGREWKYLRMPFYELQIASVPISVLIGWIPLVVGLISMVNMSKHLANKK